MASDEECGGRGDAGSGEEAEAASLLEQGPLQHVQDANATATDRALSVGDEAALPSIGQCSTSEVDSSESKSPECERNPGQEQGFRRESLAGASTLGGLAREDVESHVIEDYSQNVLTVDDYPRPENVVPVLESYPDPNSNALVEEDRMRRIEGDHAERGADEELLLNANISRKMEELEGFFFSEDDATATSQSGSGSSAIQGEHGEGSDSQMPDAELDLIGRIGKGKGKMVEDGDREGLDRAQSRERRASALSLDFGTLLQLDRLKSFPPQEGQGGGMDLDLGLHQRLPVTEQARELESRLLDSDAVARSQSGYQSSADQEEHGGGMGLEASLRDWLPVVDTAQAGREPDALPDGDEVARSQSDFEFPVLQEEHGDGFGLDALLDGDEVARSQSDFEFPVLQEEHGDRFGLDLARQKELLLELERGFELSCSDDDEDAESQSGSDWSMEEDTEDWDSAGSEFSTEKHGDTEGWDPSVPASPKRKRSSDSSEDKPAKIRLKDATNAAEATSPGSGVAGAVAVEGSRSDSPPPDSGSREGLKGKAKADVEAPAAPAGEHQEAAHVAQSSTSHAWVESLQPESQSVKPQHRWTVERFLSKISGKIESRAAGEGRDSKPSNMNR